ncbi:hypothetical protein BDW68DRAFT_182448 [Aspergillus falconensis]
MEQQILRMETELQEQYGNEDWSMTFRAGPDSIGILAECIVLTSRPGIMGIELRGVGLKSSTLCGNVSDCAQLGVKTYDKTARKMKLLAHLTNELSRPDGIIDNMLQFCQPGQSQGRDRALARYIKKGEDTVNKCTALIGEINTAFDSWCDLTGALYSALQDTQGQKQRQKQDVKNEIHKSEIDKALKEDQKTREEMRTSERRRRMQKTRKTKEKYEKYAAAAVTGGSLAEGGLAAVIASTPAVVTAGVGFVVAGAAAYIHYRSLSADLLSMEEAEERRNHEIRELEASKAILEKTLTQLNSESKSIEQVAKIVESSLKKVTELQGLVRNFTNFLFAINDIINLIAEDSEFVYGAVKTKEDLIDPGLKRDLLKHAFDMKTRFIFASKASNVYNEVSRQYIMPILNILPHLDLLKQATDDEVLTKLEELHELRCRVRTETGSLTTKMHEELKESLAKETRVSAEIFEKIISGDQESTE